MGASIETNHLTAALDSRVKELGYCNIVKDTISSISPAKCSNTLPKVELSDGTVIECGLLIANDGARS